jgi:hypothetical protein
MFIENYLTKYLKSIIQSLIMNSSTAPIASKDEQAELIRKQKAKLERHFRRSTQVKKTDRTKIKKH